jgi:magnesium chelatase family protein
LGQAAAKRALTVAAAGRHHMLMVGPPGAGKTLLSRALAELIPPLEEREVLEVAAVYSAAGLPAPPLGQAPFRDPHHSASATALVGGGSLPSPGEISLAHNGVLFLDELPHFRPSVLDHLREPLESRQVNVTRARARATFPARFQLVAAMNPCPAGRACDPSDVRSICRCSPDQARRYRARISGPLLDRIDLHVAVPALPPEVVLGDPSKRAPGPATADPRAAIAASRRRQLTRQGRCNADLEGDALARHCELDAASGALLRRAVEGYALSARGVHRILRVARTIADLEASAAVALPHLSEALGYRAMDWERGDHAATG